MLDLSSSFDKLADLIEVGDVYRMRLTRKEGVVPKFVGESSREKFFVVLGKTEYEVEIGFVLINSEVNKNLPRALQDLHYKILKEDYPFLHHDSYVCCDAVREIAIDDFFNRLESDAVGRLRKDHIDVVRSYLATSPRSTVPMLRKYGII